MSWLESITQTSVDAPRELTRAHMRRVVWEWFTFVVVMVFSRAAMPVVMSGYCSSLTFESEWEFKHSKMCFDYFIVGCELLPRVECFGEFVHVIRITHAMCELQADYLISFTACTHCTNCLTSSDSCASVFTSATISTAFFLG